MHGCARAHTCRYTWLFVAAGATGTCQWSRRQTWRLPSLIGIGQHRAHVETACISGKRIYRMRADLPMPLKRKSVRAFQRRTWRILVCTRLYTCWCHGHVPLKWAASIWLSGTTCDIDLCITMCTDMCWACAMHHWNALAETAPKSIGTLLPMRKICR